MILPWNLAREISEQLAYTAEWGARLVVPFPGRRSFEPGSLPATGPRREGRRLLRRARRAHGRGDATHPEADDPDRQPADPLAHHALLRGMGAHGVRALPRLQGRRDPRVLPRLQRGALQRLRARGARRRRPCRAPEPRRRRLADHVRRHRHAVDDRRASEGGRAAPERRRGVLRDVRRRAHGRSPRPDARRVPRIGKADPVPLGAPAVQRTSGHHGRRRYGASPSRT